ncbi:MAG: hypothetical protein OJJ21_16970 [Ferrovibrio sp.]|uniref:hypothetical protein n=1 Tax=Ferrovibrio sp. TaxID=1917215 RepID=UPI00261B2454|nr:hypothetical protein [Ferrovibrio sp.]MCW0235294.1 hypothetical protein [Ferrovibrio sp.]
MFATILSWLGGGIIKQFTGPLLDAYKAKQAATNDAARIEAEQTIARLEAARDIALAEASDRWSATRIGRLLVVLPWGIWWTAIFVVSIINPLFGTSLVILDIPPRIWDAANILIPAILIGDALALWKRK